MTTLRNTAELDLEDISRTRPERGRITLLTAVRNEAIFLLEWVAYHRVIGFERIIVFSNPSDDGTEELLDALAAEGTVEHYRHVAPEGRSPQSNAARLANEMNLFSEGDWLIWIDADEFFVVNTGGGKVEDLVRKLEKSDGVLVPWRIMGDGKNQRFPGRFVSADFSLASTPEALVNRQAKSFYRIGEWFEGLSRRGIHRPTVKKDNVKLPAFLDGNGLPLDLSTRINSLWTYGRDFHRSAFLSAAEHGYQLAQINHYFCRTAEHYLLKRRRGRGAISGEVAESNRRHVPKMYMLHNCNEVSESGILRFEKQTTKEMDRLRRSERVEAAQKESELLTAAQVAVLPQQELDALASSRVPPTRVRAEFPLTLPEGAAQKLRYVYGTAKSILEFGSGGSSFVALESSAKLLTIESDAAWADRIRADLAARFPNGEFEVRHSDIGTTGKWGRPRGSEGFARYHLYATGPWDNLPFGQPDVILIDGRFRTACFAAAAIRCTQPITVLFDDYADRPYYHWIEEIAKPTERVDRMAVFRIEPKPFPVELLTRLAASFIDPE